ncbi:MAG: YfhO family protein [Clostridia bacterium]|nr:YfhO family protein [Clostridia bacterium]
MTEKTNLQKLAELTKRNKFVFLSAAAALAISMLVAFCYNLIPFGDMTILRMDLYHQYGPLFAELYDRLHNGSSLIYSWNSGLGSSFLGNYFNYLSSPLSLVVLLFGHKNITEAISFLIMIKAVLSASTFSYYLKKVFDTDGAAISAFGVLYSFCGYFIAYYWNLMWLDAMVLFPIIMLGIERIIKKGKPALYCVSLAVMILTNYYMAYMICIFSVIYFFGFYFSEYTVSAKFKETSDGAQKLKGLKNSLFFSSALKFGLYSLLAGLLACVAVFPLITILSESSATSGTNPTSFTKYFTAFDFLANHLAGPDPTIRSSGEDVLPNVYCGIITIILVPLYLYSKKIKLRKKLAYIAMLSVLYFSFNINFLNYFWHGFHFPNDLPYRFSFMYCFLLLKIAFEALQNIKEYTPRQIMSVGLAVVFFLVFVEKITSKNVTDITLILSLVYAVGYVAILYLFTNKKFQTSAVTVLLLCTVGSEIALSSTNNYTMNQSKPNYTSDYDQFRALKNKLDGYDGKGFYRMELTDLRTRMDPCWFNYNGISTFSSMAYEKVANMQQDLGIYGNYINSYTYNPQTPIYNSFFGLKYIVDNSADDMSGNYYTKIIGDNKFTAYENNYSLPIAFVSDSEIKNYSTTVSQNPFVAQSELFRSATGLNNVFSRLETENVTYNNIYDFYSSEIENGEFRYSVIETGNTSSVCFEITPSVTDNVYIYAEAPNISAIDISSVLYSKSLTMVDEAYIYDLGVMNAGETIYIDISFDDKASFGNLNFYAYSVNKDVFEKGYNLLKNGEFVIESYDDTWLSGSINASKNSVVYTSIPYDTNWEVFVDGVRLSRDKLFKISDSLLGFDIAQGQHKIVLKYTPYSFIFGSFVTAFTIIIATIVIIVKRRKERFNKWTLLKEQDFTVFIDDTYAAAEATEQFSGNKADAASGEEIQSDEETETDNPIESSE